jgi:hypothetical protein
MHAMGEKAASIAASDSIRHDSSKYDWQDFYALMKSVVALVFAFMLLSLLAGVRPAGAQTSKWTFMVYLDADNNLEDVGLDNFLHMAQIGSSTDVDIVVQFDRSSSFDTRYGDWSTTKRFHVEKDMTPDAGNALQDLGELNMADPTTLSDFVKWAVVNYPADRFFLDIWDHGLGWQGVATDDAPNPNDHMTAIELGFALADIRSFLGRPLDILANDACRMTLEIMYQASPYVSYMVGSEKDEPAEGWPYDTVLGALAARPTMNPVQIGAVLVDRYVDSYSYPNSSSYSVTMAVVNSSMLTGVVSSLNSFIMAVNSSLPYFVDSVVQARNESEHYEGYQCNSPIPGEDFDLSDVTAKTKTLVHSGRVLSAAVELEAAVRNAVVYERHMNLDSAVNCVKAKNATGLSLWYPWTMGSKMKDYGLLALSQDSLWDEYLRTYHNSTRPHVAFTATLTPEDLDSDLRLDNARILFRASGDGVVIVDEYVAGSLLASFTYSVSSGVYYTDNFSLPYPGIYDFYLYFRQAQDMINATSFLNIQATAVLSIHGTVRDSSGSPVDGATVRVTNLRTGQNVTAVASTGSYAIDVVYPIWIENGDRLKVEADEGGRSASLEFTLSYQGSGSFIVDLYLEENAGESRGGTSLFGPYWSVALLLSASLVFELILVGFLLFGKKSSRGRTPPGSRVDDLRPLFSKPRR